MNATQFKNVLMRTFVSSPQCTLNQLSYEFPIFLVFLRHTGCSFCKQTLAKIGQAKSELENSGLKILIVSMNNDEEINPLLKKFHLENAWKIFDPNKILYKAFELTRAHWWNFLTPKVILQYIQSAWMEGHKQTSISADPFQMPGAFLLYKGRIIYAFRPEYAGDQMNYCEIIHLDEVQEAVKSA